MRIGKCLQTQGAVVETLRVRLFVVEERSGVAIGASAQVTPALVRHQKEKIHSCAQHQLHSTTESFASLG